MFRYDRKYRRGTRLSAAVICSLFMLAAAGCAPAGQSGADGDGADVDDRGGEAAPAAFPVYVTQNPITIESVPDPEEATPESWPSDRTWARISGLASAEIEKKINDRLYEKYEELKRSELPPYRGLRAVIPEDAELRNDRIWAYDYGNVNNILSICYRHIRSYTAADENGDAHMPETGDSIVMESHPMNFNLATGDEITLADLFGSGEDALRPLDEAVLTRLRDGPDDYYIRDNSFASMLPRDYQSFTLIGEYEPIRADQKFLISDMVLELIMDYETPQYSLGGLSDSMLDLPLTELGGVGADAIKRFALPDDEAAALYATGEPLERMLFMHRASILKPARGSTLASHAQIEIDEGITLDRMIMGAYETTPAFERLLTDMCSLSDDETRGLRAQRDRMRQAGGEYADESVYASLTIDFMHLGNVFTTFRFLQANIYIPSADGGDDQELRYCREERNSFDAESLALLGPAEIFAEGFDYEGLLGEALDREMANTSADGSAITPERGERDRLLKEMLANGVSLDRSGMMFYALPASGDPGDPDGQSYYPRIDYADIGYENLRIFD